MCARENTKPMNDTHFRVLLEGLDQHAQLPKLVIFFQKEIGFSEDQIRNLLTNPPRVLWEVSTHNDAQLIQTVLEKMGCQTYLEPVTGNSMYPFAISTRHHKLINRELSKILRCNANLALFLVHVEGARPGSILPSMMGPFEKKLAEHFRESDTVVGIDDSRIIILGFSTDSQGAVHLKNKTDRVLKELLGEEILISMGYALFPEEGRSLSELLRLAEGKRIGKGSGGISDTQIASSPDEPRSHVSTRNEERPTPLQLCFTKGRGKIFKRLLDMDPEILWLGLSQLPQAKQKEFLARLPFDSPIVPVLEKRINAQPRPISDKAAEQHFEAIIHQMELEQSLEERSKTQHEVVSKLNRVEVLPTLPSVAAHVFKIASNPNSSAADLTEVIVNDPSLTSKLLKIVNSAFYGFPQKIGTVRQAVVILGTEEIMDLAFGLAAAKVFEVKPLEGLYDPKTLWQHSMCTAMIAQNLCQRFPEYQRLGAFTAGLLHDFGKIFLIEHFPEMYGQIHVDVRKLGLPLFELEEESFGLNHAAIGEFLASNWNLPEALVEAIAFHHQPFSAPSHSRLAAMIGLADYLHYGASESGELPEGIPVFSPQLTSGHWNFLTQLFEGLDTGQLRKMQEDALATIKESQDLFSILD